MYSKKELKKIDPVYKTLFKIEEYVRNRWKLFLTGLIAVILIIVAVSYYNSYKLKIAVKAENKLAKILKEDKQKVKSLESFCKNNKNNLVGQRALFILASEYYKEKQYKKALEAYLTITDYDLDDLINWNVGACYEMLKQPDKAIQYYNRVKHSENKSLKKYAYLGLARCYRQKKEIKAQKAIYEDIIKLFSKDTMLIRRVKEMALWQD